MGIVRESTGVLAKSLGGEKSKHGMGAALSWKMCILVCTYK